VPDDTAAAYVHELGASGVRVTGQELQELVDLEMVEAARTMTRGHKMALFMAFPELYRAFQAAEAERKRQRHFKRAEGDVELGRGWFLKQESKAITSSQDSIILDGYRCCTPDGESMPETTDVKLKVPPPPLTPRRLQRIS
jgi:hypothetical protein